jgi:hypothetical protein|tara:strand:- start:117 stop:542 length:426 start_codon:yes stop_codon:yes gene_type:complete
MANRELGKWKLPQPLDLHDETEWLPIPRIARTVPFGYELDSTDDSMLLPIKQELDLLHKAKSLVKQYSYREVALWLTKNSGRHISHVGLMKRLKNEKRRKNKAFSLRRWADYAQKAIQKAEQIEESRTGARNESSGETATT